MMNRLALLLLLLTILAMGSAREVQGETSTIEIPEIFHAPLPAHLESYAVATTNSSTVTIAHILLGNLYGNPYGLTGAILRNRRNSTRSPDGTTQQLRQDARNQFQDAMEDSFQDFATRWPFWKRRITVQSYGAYLNKTIGKMQRRMAKKQQRVYPSQEFVEQASIAAVRALLGDSVRGALAEEVGSDSSENRTQELDVSVNRTQFEAYFTEALNQTVTVYPNLCAAVQERIQHCQRDVTNSTVMHRKLNGTISERLHQFNQHCFSGLTVLSQWRVEACVLSPPSVEHSVDTVDACFASYNCFLTPKEQHRFDTTLVAANDTQPPPQALSGLHYTNYTSLDPHQFGISMMWASVLAGTLGEKIENMGWTYFGIQVGVGVAFSAVLSVFCLPCLVIVGPAFVAANVGMAVGSFVVAEGIYPNKGIQEKSVNQTMMEEILQ